MSDLKIFDKGAPGRVAFGLTENVASTLSYAGFFITGIVFLVCERENKFVRFNALQSIITFGALSLAISIASAVPLLGGIVAWALGTVQTLLWLFLMYNAILGKTFKVPLIGDTIWSQIYK